MRDRRRVQHTRQDDAEFLAYLDSVAEDPGPAPEELRRLWSRRDTFVTAPPCCADRPCSEYCTMRQPINLGALACVFISVLSFALGLVGVAVRGSTPWALIPVVMLGSGAIMCLRMPSPRRRRRR